MLGRAVTVIKRAILRPATGTRIFPAAMKPTLWFATLTLSALSLSAVSAADNEADARKAEKVTPEEAAKKPSVQASAAGTFGTKKRTISKEGVITEHDTSQKLKVRVKDHGDAGAKQDELEKQKLVEKLNKKSATSSTAAVAGDDLPKKEGAATASAAGTEVKVAKAVPAKEGEGATVSGVQQGNAAKNVKLTAEQERLLKEQLRAKESTEEQLRQQRKILDKTPETDKMKNPTLKKRGSFTR